MNSPRQRGLFGGYFADEISIIEGRIVVRLTPERFRDAVRDAVRDGVLRGLCVMDERRFTAWNWSFGP